MLNVEKYKDEIKERAFYHQNVDDGITVVYNMATGHIGIEATEKLIDWLCSEYQEPILDFEEKEYLSNVIKPFRNKVLRIEKVDDSHEEEKIFILTKALDNNVDNDIASLPPFKEGTMYKGMKLYKKYTLRELGL